MDVDNLTTNMVRSLKFQTSRTVQTGYGTPVHVRGGCHGNGDPFSGLWRR